MFFDTMEPRTENKFEFRKHGFDNVGADMWKTA